tara:strand:- start:446 stop:652 length:207 start_codon:yes stop_codon:yes gene_type:complete
MSDKKIDLPVGLTKKEYFAAMALQGLLSNTEVTKAYLKDGLIDDIEAITMDAVEFADSLLVDLFEPGE